MDAWKLLVAVHAAKTETRFDLVPSKPDLRADQQQAMAECLIRGATQLRKKLEQAGIERDVVELQRELAERVMGLYFKHDSEHLKRVKWALRDLHRELDARLIEAMEQLLREARDAMNAPRVLSDKPAPVAKTKPVESLPAPPVDNAREAQRIIEMLEGPPKLEVPHVRREATTAHIAERQQIQRVPDKPTPIQPSSGPVQCLLGRSGAHRWGTLGPPPAKVRTMTQRPVEEGSAAGEEKSRVGERAQERRNLQGDMQIV